MLISFEGIDGCGKTTQMGLLHDRLVGHGAETLALREPGGTDVSESIRELLLDPEYRIDSIAELLLFSAARAQLVSERIRPALEKDAIVLLDRFFDSTIAYQGYGRKIGDIAEIDAINRFATGGLMPDLTFYFDVDIKTAALRKSGGEADRIEREGDGFFDRVREGYMALARENTHRFVTVDATLPMLHVHELVWNQVKTYMSRHSGIHFE